MRPPTPPRDFGLLVCPHCHSDLKQADRSLVCDNKHSFDLAGSGYVNLMVGRRRSVARGDSRQQLGRREAFLAAGCFDFISEAILRQVKGGLPRASRRHARVLDAGCGTGHHLNRVVAGLSGHAGAACAGLGLDVCKEAARLASNRWQDPAFAVTDLWSQWPIRSRSADLVINIFAPKNPQEMARVIRPGGTVIIAYPGPRHLDGLRRPFGLMADREGKTAAYGRMLRRLFGDVRRERHLRSAILDRTAIADLIMMGPNAARMSESSIPSRLGRMPVTFDVELLVARRPRCG